MRRPSSAGSNPSQCSNSPSRKAVRTRTKLSILGCSYVIHNPRLPGQQGGDVTNALTRRELTGGGEDRIPYLGDTDRKVTMYEAEDIVAYLGEHYG